MSSKILRNIIFENITSSWIKKRIETLEIIASFNMQVAFVKSALTRVSTGRRHVTGTRGSVEFRKQRMNLVMMDPCDCENKKCCADCKTTKTPLWRGGPAGPKTLCNACGIRYRKKKGCSRKREEVVLLERTSSVVVKKQRWGEEEQAALCLMALSCGFLFAHSSLELRAQSSELRAQRDSSAFSFLLFTTPSTSDLELSRSATYVVVVFERRTLPVPLIITTYFLQMFFFFTANNTFFQVVAVVDSLGKEFLIK
ncbi:hypothetical protein VNO78_18301 [Psophocarpus tetragonolobus]|uniref:GATA-type domain-containing protein n=1 Tax=Psophocarpus tetragonolobus TaxID=3891 RepID=A0AAN9SI64_PSOTE